ncbi:hypothetical protein PRUPE_7G079700 [Prunus persica]|uniref:Uncharacterized protein n=1 Tax=Prunus persica TaxID=3760 RepID=A0A251N8C0_PRUPE|nr:hypothetical protein PRUPE_7G079700 [Prunus persica]
MDMQSFDRMEKHCIPIIISEVFFKQKQKQMGCMALWLWTNKIARVFGSLFSYPFGLKRGTFNNYILFLYSREYNARLLCAPAMRSCGLQNTIVRPWRVVASL